MSRFNPAHFVHGLTNVTKVSNTGLLRMLDPSVYHSYFNDFDTYLPSEWVITTVELGAGSATEALADADGGVLLITNDAADNDSDFFNKVGESFLFTTDIRTIFKARFKVSDATQSDFIMGLQITDTTPLAVSDGVYFQKDDGDANLDFHVTKNGTSTSQTAVATVVDDTYIEVGFYYNGIDAVEYFIDDVRTGSSVITNLPDDEILTISFGIQNGVAVAKTMSIDYIFCAQERS